MKFDLDLYAVNKGNDQSSTVSDRDLLLQRALRVPLTHLRDDNNGMRPGNEGEDGQLLSLPRVQHHISVRTTTRRVPEA